MGVLVWRGGWYCETWPTEVVWASRVERQRWLGVWSDFLFRSWFVSVLKFGNIFLCPLVEVWGGSDGRAKEQGQVQKDLGRMCWTRPVRFEVNLKAEWAQNRTKCRGSFRGNRPTCASMEKLTLNRSWWWWWTVICNTYSDWVLLLWRYSDSDMQFWSSGLDVEDWRLGLGLVLEVGGLGLEGSGLGLAILDSTTNLVVIAYQVTLCYLISCLLVTW